MPRSYSQEEVAAWLSLSPEQRLFESEALWEEFRIKHPATWQPFSKTFDSFEEYRTWLVETGNPVLW